MTPSTLAKALRQLHRMTPADPRRVRVDGFSIGLGTALMLAAENLDKAALYDALVATLRQRFGAEYAAGYLVSACAEEIEENYQPIVSGYRNA